MEIDALIQLTLVKRWSGEQHPPDELIQRPLKDYGKMTGEDYGKPGAVPLDKGRCDSSAEPILNRNRSHFQLTLPEGR